MPQTDTQPPPNDASVSQIPNLLLKTPRLLRVIIPVRQQTAVCEEATIFQAPRAELVAVIGVSDSSFS